MKTANNNTEKKGSLSTTFKSRTFRVGGYSVIATVIVLIIAIVINVLVGALPTRWTQLDATSTQLFSFSDQTKTVLASLEDDVSLYWIVRTGGEDDYMQTLLDRYSSLSSHVSYQKIDPDVYPTFLTNYGEVDSPNDNSVLVVCGDYYRYIDYYSIYVYDYMTYYYSGELDVDFDGESQLTSAISYVTSGYMPKLYTLTGHGEATLSDTFSAAVENQNFQTEDLSLLTEESVPDDADVVLIYEPSSDISSEEETTLLDYLQIGGNLIVITDPIVDGEMTNLQDLMAQYGVTAVDGIVIEGNANYYLYGYPYYLLPDLTAHTVTDPLIDDGYYVLLPLAQGLAVSDDLPDGVSVTQLLTTTSSSYSKIDGYNLTTMDKEDGDIDGPFALGVAITDTIDDDTSSNIMWVTSSYLLDDTASSMVSGGNEDLFLNALSWMTDQDDSVSIHSKSLTTEYLTISSGAGVWLDILAIGLIPAIVLAIGIVIFVRRRHR